MLKLVYCEFLKLKRKKFILLTIFAAILFPIPLTAFAAKGNVKPSWLYSSIYEFGFFLLLPIVLGILGAILFLTEKENDTQKNINSIPVSTANLIIAKIIILLIFAIIFSLVTIGTTLIGGFLINSVDRIFYRLFLGLVIGIMVAFSTLPVITIECLCKKGYIFSIIISFIYAIVNFISVLAISNLLLPLAAVFRWALPYIATGATDEFENWFMSFPICIGILILSTIVSITLAVVLKNEQDI